MCGIAGIVCTDNGPIRRDALLAMRDVFPYRGPDDAGVWLRPQGRLGLAHRRLSILDTTAAGHQPMHDAQRGLWTVYNGEVYNYLEIRAELEQEGALFRTGTDTEVVLAAYGRWGFESLRRFNGMFALAIWDEAERRLFLARDRLGVKPLYYHWNGKTLLFASEIKSILRALKERPSVSSGLIDAYMSFGYVPGEQTLFEGIRRILPGHYLVLDAKGLRTARYWDLHFGGKEALSMESFRDEARALLEDSIRLRLRSDVPLGIFLSGGIDSSTVVGLLAAKVSEPLKTFSVAYDFGSQYDESTYARLVARRFHTDHHEIFLTPREFTDFVPKYVWLMDEPVTEAAAISLYFISRLAKSHVTVVLSGEGSDELFAGYDFYAYMNFLEVSRKAVGPCCLNALERLGRSLLPRDHKILKYLELAALPLEQRYKGISTYPESHKGQLYRQEFFQAIEASPDREGLKGFVESLFQATANNDPLSRMLYFDTKTWLVDDLLIKADRMSMAASLELRVPFLDYRLVELAARIPSKFKIRRGETKAILKEMVKDVLPSEIVYRKKMGFPAPLDIMLRGELLVYARDILLAPSARLRPYFKASAMEALLDRHRRGIRGLQQSIWQLVVLETWMRAAAGEQGDTLPEGI